MGALAIALAFSSCSTDWDKVYLSSLESNQLTASNGVVILNNGNSKDVVLSLVWNAQTIAISNPNMSAPNVTQTYLQASLKPDFSSNMSETQETNLSQAYLGSEINTLVKNLGAKPGVANVIYFRLRASLGNNMTPVYSNITQVSITPYSIDMSVGLILDSSKDTTNVTLYSQNSDGIYKGFMGVSGWSNFYLEEGDGTLWGNDATTGAAFEASSASGSWNFWFPGNSGCYYTIVNTQKKQWSALYLPSMTVSGDISGNMTYDKSSGKWTMPFTAASAGTIHISLGTTGAQYDYSTGTDDTKAISTAFGFVQDGNNLDVSSTPGTIAVNVPQAGNCELVLDLSNPKAYNLSVQTY